MWRDSWSSLLGEGLVSEADNGFYSCVKQDADQRTPNFLGIGLMMAKALENSGATVYIVGRRLDVLEKAAKGNNVRELCVFPHSI